ncbi:MAG: cytochrome c oxidase subunit 3 family protein, partial [Phycisphaerae bacterium]
VLYAAPDAGHADHDPNLAHHFDTAQQQFDAGKLGLWLFLTTEILLFSGMFCIYAVYRHNHPEIFEYGSQWLNKILGGTNTIVLIFSSFTMAWAVRAAQLGQQKLLVRLLAITLLCGFVFLGVKFVEYREKWRHHTLWGLNYQPLHPPGEHAAAAPANPTAGTAASSSATPAGPAAAMSLLPGITTPALPVCTKDGTKLEQSQYAESPLGPPGVAAQVAAPEESDAEPANVQIFFGIYFVMTGLHGLHVIAGMAVIAWILRRAIRGDFGSGYFNPVDFTGLYWHLVDLVWIFLFPLLYLIH